jgi:hypothetical protein
MANEGREAWVLGCESPRSYCIKLRLMLTTGHQSENTIAMNVIVR